MFHTDESGRLQLVQRSRFSVPVDAERLHLGVRQLDSLYQHLATVIGD
jgi:hypothetical protein